MIRTCDGTDPNLIMHVHEDGSRCTAVQRRACPQVDYRTEPCDCGLTFDDVERMVVYPHARV